MEFMAYDQGIAFVAAVQDIYGIDLSKDPKGPILKDSVRHGMLNYLVERVYLY